MIITVRVIGPLAQAYGFSEKELDVPEGTTAGGLMALLAIGGARPRIVTRGGQAIAPGEALAGGDRIVISPIYSGG
jgi:molybdopterin converting factor small subunit